MFGKNNFSLLNLIDRLIWGPDHWKNGRPTKLKISTIYTRDQQSKAFECLSRALLRDHFGKIAFEVIKYTY